MRLLLPTTTTTPVKRHTVASGAMIVGAASGAQSISVLDVLLKYRYNFVHITIRPNNYSKNLYLFRFKRIPLDNVLSQKNKHINMSCWRIWQQCTSCFQTVSNHQYHAFKRGALAIIGVQNSTATSSCLQSFWLGFSSRFFLVRASTQWQTSRLNQRPTR